MSVSAEDDLIALVANEQRGFRRILFAGFAVLLVLVAMSAALGVYYYYVSNSLTDASTRLQREAFMTRNRVDAQTNRVAAQELAIRRAYDEIRGSETGAASQPSPDVAFEAVRAYLLRDHHGLVDERVIETVGSGHAEGDPRAALFAGAAALLGWERSGEQIQAGSRELPQPLAAAEAHFRKAAADPGLAGLAQTGIGWVRFIYASSAQSNFAPKDCEAVFAAVSASAVDGAAGPQPLYWRAQCERKLGRTSDALRDYALALQQSGDVAAPATGESELTLAMNAFHGVGTVLVAAFDAPEDADMKTALDLADRACAPAKDAAGSARMRLAHACLDQAIALRRRLDQTDNQVSGSRENLGFVYLRDNDFAGALENASNVERTGLFPWNELVRALAAKHVATPDARKIEREARRNVRFFEIGQFNACELRKLLNPALFEDARAIVAEEHKGENFGCP